MSETVSTDSANLPTEVGLKINEICDRFEAAWRSGEKARVEDYLADTPEPVQGPLLRELVLLEMEYRRLNGDDPKPEEYWLRFPELPWSEIARKAPSPEIMAPRYQLLEEVGKGGMGLVYRAWDLDCSREVAVKVMHAKHQGQLALETRFFEGARLTSQLQHPGVPPVHEIGWLPDGRPFFAMKLVQGRTLADLLHERKDPTANLAHWLRIFGQVCQAVACAHSQNVIHRDLKPLNIMVGAFGEVQVMDWGLAKSLDAERADQLPSADPPTYDAAATSDATVSQYQSQEGAVMGTAAYMAPEQARGEVRSHNPRSDVFGLGAILCEILTGHAPYQAAKADVLAKAASADLEETFNRLNISGADSELIQLATSCLAADQNSRPMNAGVVAARIAQYQASVEQRLRQAEMDKAATTIQMSEQRKRRRLRFALAASVLFLLSFVGVGSGWFAWQRDQAGVEAETLLKLSADLQRQFRWAEARTALVQAGRRLESVGSPELRERVRAAGDDLEWAARLDAIRLKRWTMVEGKLDSASAARDYAAAFRQAGWDGTEETLAAATEFVKSSALRPQWVAALDDWALATEDRAERNRVLLLAHETDPIRSAWRVQLRDPKVWNNRDELTKLADAAPAEKDAPVHLLTALSQRLLVVKGDAAPLLRTAHARHPGDFWVNFTLGTLLIRREPEMANSAATETVDAVGYLRAALIVRPESGVVHNNLAIALDTLGRSDDAIASYREAVRHEPGYAVAYNNLGIALAKRYRLDEALASYAQAVRLDPKFAKAWYNQGVSLARKGKADQAIAAFTTAKALDPKLIPAHDNIGIILSRKGEFDKLEKKLRDDIERDAKNVSAHFNLGNLHYDRGRLDEARKEYGIALELDPKHIGTRNNLGVALATLGLHEVAVTVYKEGIRLHPEESRYHYNLGNALLAQEQFAQAASAFRETIRLSPRDAQALHNLGVALARMGKLDDAMAAYRDALRITPSDAVGHCNLGMALARKGDLDEAMSVFRTALQHSPTHGKALYNLAVVEHRKGRLKEAVDHYRSAFTFQPKYTQAAFNFGPARADKNLLHEAPAAFAFFREGLHLEPRFPQSVIR